MGSKRPCHVSVKLGGKIRTFEQMIRQFARECKDVGIVRDVRQRAHFISNNAKKRKKRHVGKMRQLKRQKKNR
jgi:ribosomal protein S21